jgi:hypothetical protein
MTEMSNFFGETISNNGYMEKNSGRYTVCVMVCFFEPKCREPNILSHGRMNYKDIEPLISDFL